MEPDLDGIRRSYAEWYGLDAEDPDFWANLDAMVMSVPVAFDGDTCPHCGGEL